MGQEMEPNLHQDKQGSSFWNTGQNKGAKGYAPAGLLQANTKH